MNNFQREIVKKISIDAVELDWNKAFAGKAYGNRHLFRVSKIIKYLCKKEGGDLFIAEVGGLVHDVSLAWGSDYDMNHVEKYTRLFLNKYRNLNKEQIDKIVECATLHEESVSTTNIEPKIVHDADIIDKGGMLGVIRHVWKMTNMLENRLLNKKSDFNLLKQHLNQRTGSVYTDTAKSLMKTLDHQMDIFFAGGTDSIQIMKLISAKAQQGVTSDKIAQFMIKNLPSKTTHNLKSQLSCSYLKK